MLRLLHTADQLMHSASYDAEGIKKRLDTVDKQCEDFMIKLDSRRKNLAMAINFFLLAKTVNLSFCIHLYYFMVHSVEHSLYFF